MTLEGLHARSNTVIMMSFPESDPLSLSGEFARSFGWAHRACSVLTYIYVGRRLESLMHWLLFLFLSFSSVAGRSTGIKCSEAFVWTYNADGDSPCDVASQLLDVCSPGGVVQPRPIQANTGTVYAPKNISRVPTPCVCNSVTYSLVSACGLCQGQNFMSLSWGDWVEECNGEAWNTSFPKPIPVGLEIPKWTYLDVVTSESFNDTLALQNATLTAYHEALKTFNLQISMVVLSGMTYGIVIVLSLNCGYEMIWSEHHPKQTRVLLFAYIVCMAVLSSVAFLEVVVFLWSDFSHNGIGQALSILYFSKYYIPTSLPFLIWGADGFMIFRCQALYADISRVSRVLLLLLLCLLSATLLGTGILFFFLPGNYWCGIILPTSTLVNIILSAFIALRTAYLQRRNRRVMGISGTDNSPYARIMTICLESSALMILNGVVTVVLLIHGSNYKRDGFMKIRGWVLVPLMIFPHICVISPLLISYRVAHGRDVTTLPSTPLKFEQRKDESYEASLTRHMSERLALAPIGSMDSVDELPAYIDLSRQSTFNVSFNAVQRHGYSQLVLEEHAAQSRYASADEKNRPSAEPKYKPLPLGDLEEQVPLSASPISVYRKEEDDISE